MRLNPAEFAPLFGGDPADEAASRVAKACATVVALTGGTDIVTDGARRVSIRNGHSLMGLVTAMGCAGSALLCAALAVETDAWLAAVAALAALGVAGEVAGADRARARQLRRRHHRCAARPRSRDVARTNKGLLMMKLDLRLNAIVDPERAGGRDLAELARLCVEGGATLIQLRDKQSDTRVMVEEARAIKTSAGAVSRAIRRQRPGRRGARRRAPTACISARTI